MPRLTELAERIERLDPTLAEIIANIVEDIEEAYVEREPEEQGVLLDELSRVVRAASDQAVGITSLADFLEAALEEDRTEREPQIAIHAKLESGSFTAPELLFYFKIFYNNTRYTTSDWSKDKAIGAIKEVIETYDEDSEVSAEDVYDVLIGNLPLNCDAAKLIVTIIKEDLEDALKEKIDFSSAKVIALA